MRSVKHMTKMFQDQHTKRIKWQTTKLILPTDQLLASLTTRCAVHPEWMLGLEAFYASLRHRRHVCTCRATLTNLGLIERPRWRQLAAGHLGSWRDRWRRPNVKGYSAGRRQEKSQTRGSAGRMSVIRCLLCAGLTVRCHWTPRTVWTEL